MGGYGSGGGPELSLPQYCALPDFQELNAEDQATVLTGIIKERRGTREQLEGELAMSPVREDVKNIVAKQMGWKKKIVL